jgi:hypothetical protein
MSKYAIVLLLLCASAWAAVSRDGSCAAATTACTVGTGGSGVSASGDLAIFFAYRNASTTPPTLPSGYTSIATSTGGATNSFRVYCHEASGGSDASGTATSATGIIGLWYSGTGVPSTAACATQAVAIGVVASGNQSSGTAVTSVTYPSLTTSSGGMTSWIVGFMGDTVATDDCTPSGMTAVTSNVGNVISSDTNGAVASWAGGTCTVTAATYRTFVLEILAASPATGGTPTCQNFTDQSEPLNAVFTGAGYLRLYAPRNLLVGNSYFVFVTSSVGDTITVTDSANDSYYTAITKEDTTNTQIVTLFYAPNVAAGANQIEVHYSTSDQWITAQGMECTGVATANAVDVTSGNFAQSNTITAGSATPTASGELVIQGTWNDWTNPTSVTSFTAGSQTNITWALANADRAVGIAMQWGVYNSTAALNATMAQTGTSTGFVSVSAFFKTALAGTAFPASGIQIDAMKTLWILPTASGAPYGTFPRTEQFACPAADNAMVVQWVGPSPDTLTGITDSDSNTWTSTGTAACNISCTQSYYAQNATVSAAQNLTFSGSNGDDSAKLYCIRGASAGSFFDKTSTNSGDQTTAGTITASTTFTPSTATGLVLADIGVTSNTQIGTSSPSGSIFTSCLWSQQSVNPGGCDENNGWSTYLNATTSAETWTWTAWTAVAAGEWASRIDAFEAKSACSNYIGLLGVGCK